MTTKERAVLRGLASTMDDIIIIGKGGITANVVDETDKALAARELVKGRVLEASLLTAREALETLAARTGAEEVQHIGSKFVLYRANAKLPEGRRIKLTR